MQQGQLRSQRNRRRSFSGLALASVATLAIGGVAIAEHAGIYAKKAVDPALAAYTPLKDLSGRLTIAGSDTMQPLLKRLGSDFSLQYPDVKLAVDGRGSSAAIHEFVMGTSTQRRGDKGGRSGHDGASQTSILASSRELKPSELRAFSSRHGYEPLVFPIALDAVAIYVNAQNPIQGLTIDEVDAIFSTTRKRGLPREIGQWSQLGLEEGWVGQPIHLYGRDKSSGTHDFFIDTVLNGGALKNEVNEQPGSASEILSIARDPLAIGYAGVGFQSSMVKVVPLAGEAGKGFVEPNVETVTNGTYPLGRSLYLYVNQAPNSKFNPIVHEFLKYVNSRQGQESVVNARAYPLPLSVVNKNVALLNGGTLTASRESVGSTSN